MASNWAAFYTRSISLHALYVFFQPVIPTFTYFLQKNSNHLYHVCVFFLTSLIDRRGFVDEEQLREEEQSYGAVSSIPQVILN